jgi:hypothetical protein
MDHEDSLIEAARRASRATDRTMKDYRLRYVHDEDDVTGYLLGALRTELSGAIVHLYWSAAILRHRKGVAAEEKRFGADILIHVSLETETLKYSKGVLVQAKRLERTTYLFRREYETLIDQCNKMLAVTPAAFVFAYAYSGMRCGSATAIAGSTSHTPYEQCVWTSYRFYRELFLCPIGDPKITSADPRDLPVPSVLKIAGSDRLSSEGLGGEPEELP